MIHPILINSIINIWCSGIGIPRNNTLTSQVRYTRRKRSRVVKISSIYHQCTKVTRGSVCCHGIINRSTTRIAGVDGVTGKSWTIRQGFIWTIAPHRTPLKRISSITTIRSTIIAPKVIYIIRKCVWLKECILKLVSHTVSQRRIGKSSSFFHSF